MTSFDRFKNLLIYTVFVVIAITGSKIGGHIMDGIGLDDQAIRFLHGLAWGGGSMLLAFRTMKRVQ